MGNTDSKLQSVYHSHFQRLATPINYPNSNSNDNNETDKKINNKNDDTTTIIPLFDNNINPSFIHSLLFQNNNNDRQQDLLLDYSVYNKYPIFNHFFMDFYSTDNTNNVESFHIDKQILNIIINNNYENYENLLRFVILQFILYSKAMFLIITSSSNNNNNISFCPKKLIQNLLLSIKLLINLLPTYYSYQNDTTSNNNNNNISDTDFIWNDKSLDIILNIKDNFFHFNNKNEVGSFEPNCSLGQLIVENLLNLSFINGFTIYPNTTTTTTNDTVPVWENGLFTKDTFLLRQYPRLDLNRLYCLKLWLTLFSIDLYKVDIHLSNRFINSNNNNNNRFIQSLLNLNSKKLNFLFLSIINLLSVYGNNFKLNLIQNSYYSNGNIQVNNNNNISNNTDHYYSLKRIDDSIIPNNKKVLLDLKSKLIITGLQFINLVLYYITINNIKNTSIQSFLENFMQREFDFKLLLTSFVKIFKYPIDKCIEIELNPLSFNNNLTSSFSNPSANVTNSKSSSSSSSSSPSINNSTQSNKSTTNNDSNSIKSNLPHIPDLLIQFMLFLKSFININHGFKNYFIEKFANKFIIFNIYYIKYYSNIKSYNSSLIPLCYTLTLTLLNERLTLDKLLKTFTINYYTNKLPNFYKLPNLELNNIESLTYRDFIIIHLSNYNAKLIKQNLIPNNLNFEIIYNILPINNTTINIKSNDLPKSALSYSSQDSTLYSNQDSNDIMSFNAVLSLINLFNKMSMKSYLSSYSNNEIYYVKGSQYFDSIQSLSLPSWKLDQLALMIRTFLKIIAFHYDESKNLLFLLCKYQSLLFQIKDSIQFISKILFSNPSKLNDYLFNHLSNIKALQKIEYMTQLNQVGVGYDRLNNNSGNNNNNTNGNNYSNLPKDNLNAENLSLNHSTTLIFNKVPSDADPIENGLKDNTISGIENNNNNSKRKIKIIERSDYNYDLYFENKFIYTIFQTQWPWGLNENHKLKLSKTVSVDPTKCTFWTGYSDFKLLAKIIKLIVLEFPEIVNTKRKAEFSILMKKFDVFKPKLFDKLKDYLPIYLLQPNFYSGIKFSDNDDHICSRWLYKLCWTDIFNRNSYYYQYNSEVDGMYQPSIGTNQDKVFFQNKKLNNGMSMNGHITNRSGSLASSSSSPLLPTLEKWSSNNSALSRTQSNNGSILNFFTQDNGNSVNNTDPTMFTGNSDGDYEKKSMHNSSNNKNWGGNNNNNNNNNNPYVVSSPASSSSSFFKFAWSHFQKGKDINNYAIQEEATTVNNNSRNIVDDDDEEIQNIYTKTYNYPIDLYKIPDDEEILKDNIWVNTKVRLFVLKRDEKEELTFFNVTSSLLRKFKFSNNSNDSEYNENSRISISDSPPIKSTPITINNNDNYNSNNNTPLTRPIRRYF